MKKLIAISILLTVLSAVAFAQFKAELTADLYPDVLKAKAPTGDNADKDKTYQGAGTFDFLSTQETWKANELKLKLTYTGENYEGSIRWNLDSALGKLVGASLRPGYSTTTDYGLFGMPFDDFYVKGNVGIISGYFGNTANRGVTNAARFQNFSNFMDNIKIDNYGVWTPTRNHDTNDIRRRANGTSNAYL